MKENLGDKLTKREYAEIRDASGVLYCNDGDWVESCTALVEDFNGRLSILLWAAESRRLGAKIAA